VDALPVYAVALHFFIEFGIFDVAAVTAEGFVFFFVVKP